MYRNRNRLNRAENWNRLNAASSGLSVLAGLWLIATPWIYSRFAPNDAGVWNSIIVGIIVTVFAAARFYGGAATVGLAWVNAILGAWMIASPFVYGYAPDQAFTWNSIIVGVIVFVLAVASATAAETPEAERYPYAGFFGPYDRYGAPFYAPSRQGTPGPEWYAGLSRGRVGGEYRGRGPRGYRRSDEQIKNDLCDLLCEDPALDATDIEVRVTGGEVTLQGTVSSRYAKRLAEDLADSVSGVRDVHNDLRIPGVAAPEAPRRIA